MLLDLRILQNNSILILIQPCIDFNILVGIPRLLNKRLKEITSGNQSTACAPYRDIMNVLNPNRRLNSLKVYPPYKLESAQYLLGSQLLIPRIDYLMNIYYQTLLSASVICS